MFLLGSTNSVAVQIAVFEEATMYEDIIQGIDADHVQIKLSNDSSKLRMTIRECTMHMSINIIHVIKIMTVFVSMFDLTVSIVIPIIYLG